MSTLFRPSCLTVRTVEITEGNAAYRHPLDVSPNSRAEHVIRFVDFFIRICHVSSHWNDGLGRRMLSRPFLLSYFSATRKCGGNDAEKRIPRERNPKDEGSSAT
jgi:hypothetical protein